MSDLPRSLSIVSYAVNGSGLGHVARQVAIHRWLRRYASFAGVATQHWFLTTSGLLARARARLRAGVG